MQYGVTSFVRRSGTSINQITLSPADGHSFSFQHCIDENISTNIVIQIIFRQKWPVRPMMPTGCTYLLWASLTLSLSLSLSLLCLCRCHSHCLVVGHRSDLQTKGTVWPMPGLVLPISYFGASLTISISYYLNPCQGRQYVSHPLSLIVILLENPFAMLKRMLD